MSYDYLIQSLREQVARLRFGQERVTEPVDETEVDARESVRKLARTRVAELMRQLRAVHGFNYEQIQSETGLSQQLLFDFEYKDRRLTLDELRLLTTMYGVSVDDVLGVDLE